MPDADCVFCQIIRGQLPGKMLHSDADVVAFRDVNPRAPTHILILPRKHVPSVNDLTEDETESMGRLYLVARDLAKRERIAERGYRLVMNTGAGAGQSVPHIHLHLLGGRPMSWPPG